MSPKRTRADNRKERRAKRGNNHERFIQRAQAELTVIPEKPKLIVLRPLTNTQRLYDASILTNIVTFGTGPAGTGKTWWAAMRAADMLKRGEIDKIIITRPAVEAGEEMGFLPGEIADKFAPYFAPVADALKESLGAGHLEYLIKVGKIEAAPLAYLRGRTFKNCFVIFDEAQNATPTQMKLFLTRIGEDAKVVVNGDITQSDLPRGQKSGLQDGLEKVKAIRGVGLIEFTRADIVRSGFCQDIVVAYETQARSDGPGYLREVAA